MKTIFIALLAAVLRAQEPAGASAGAIEGNLRDAISRAPVSGGKVLLRGPASRTMTTASDGGFRFDQLAAGDYDLSVQKAGYVDSSKAMATKSVRLKSGAVTESVVLDLSPLGKLEGAVLGEDAKPLSGVSVTMAGVSQMTGKDGGFVFEDIVPGSYQVTVGVPHAVRAANLVRDTAAGDFYGYSAAQYYPGADDARLAIPVDIGAGAHLRNVDLRLRRTLLVELSGKLVDVMEREPAHCSGVQLIGAVPGTPDPLWRNHPPGADGTFRFSLLQPGAYKLAIYGCHGSMLPYLYPIQLGKAGADELPVPVPPFARIQGSMKLTDPKLQWQGSGSVRLLPSVASPSAVAASKPDGSFEFESVPPGDYRVEMMAQNLRLTGNRSRKLIAKEIRFGTQNVLRAPLTVVESGNPALEVELSDEPAGIAGTVVEDGGAKGNYLVTVGTPARTEGPQRGGLSFATTANPNFEFSDLAPGDYEITAWRFTPRAGFNATPGMGRTCDETVKVTVKDGAVATITVRPCPQP